MGGAADFRRRAARRVQVGTLKGDIILKAGDVLFVPYGVVHAAKNVGTTDAAELGTYVVEKGKPLTEIVK